jgi:Tol biopolymer transport system component
VLLAMLVSLAAMMVPPPAGAAFPGANGSIAYQGYDGGFSVASVTPDGAIQRNLGVGGGPSWSPNGSLIAFASQLPSSQIELSTMAPDGSGRTQVTSLGSASFPAWSPDGSKFALASYSTTTSNYDIWTVAVNGTNATQLTSSLAEDIAPSWSPDGSRIAFQTNRDGDREIYVMDADGGHLTDLTNRHASEEESADWSPDGSKIVFSSIVPNGSPEVFVMNAAAGGVTRLGVGYYPTWSPDGNRVAFTRSAAGGTNLFTMKADGSDVVQVTHDGGEKVMTDWQPLSPASVTQTTLSTPVGAIVYGDSTLLTSTVTSAGPAPTGVMQFRVNGVNDGGPVVVDAGGRAEYDPPFLLDVGDVASATYGGDARLGWSSGEAALRVLPAATTTSLVTSANPVARGQTINLFVTVANTDTDVPPFGSVQFSVDGAPVGSPIGLDDNGQVGVGLLANVAAGEYRVSASYYDDTAAIADFAPSTTWVLERVTESATTPPGPTQTQASATNQPTVKAAVTKKDLVAFAKLIEQALRRRGFAALTGTGPLFTAAQPGTLSQRIYASVPTGSVRGSAARRTLISAGQHSFPSLGSGRLQLRLTAAGKRAIRRASRLKVDVITRYAPAAGKSVSTTSNLRVKKRAATRAAATRAAHAPGHANSRGLLLRP